MKKRIIYLVIIVLIILGVVYLRVNSKNRASTVQVKTSEANVGEIKSYLSTTGTVASKTSKDYFGAAGKVKALNVKVGDKVTKGQVLLSYDLTDANNSVKSAKLSYDNAVLTRNDTNNQNEKIKNQIADLDSQISALQNSKNVEDVKALATAKQQRAALSPITDEKIKQLDNAVELSKIAYDSANNRLNQSGDIVCEGDGIVTAVNCEVSSSTNGATPIITVQDNEGLKVIVSLSKFDSEKVKLDQEAVIKSGDKEYKGRVSFINPAATKPQVQGAGDVSLGIEVEVLDKAPELKINFDCDLDILLGTASNVLRIPSEAVKAEKADKYTVYTVKDGKAVAKDVTLGLQSDDYTEIKSGLSSGDKVILNPGVTIKDGVKVIEK